MAMYRLFLIRDGEPMAQVLRDCADDLDAPELARTLCTKHVVEVYCYERLVARVKQGDEPLNVNDARSG